MSSLSDPPPHPTFFMLRGASLPCRPIFRPFLSLSRPLPRSMGPVGWGRGMPSLLGRTLGTALVGPLRPLPPLGRLGVFGQRMGGGLPLPSPRILTLWGSTEAWARGLPSGNPRAKSSASTSMIKLMLLTTREGSLLRDPLNP